MRIKGSGKYSKWDGNRVVYGLLYPDTPLHSAVFYVGSTGNLLKRMGDHLSKNTTCSGSAVFQNTPGAYVHVFYYEKRMDDGDQKKRFRIIEQRIQEVYKGQLKNVYPAFGGYRNDIEVRRKYMREYRKTGRKKKQNKF